MPLLPLLSLPALAAAWLAGSNYTRPNIVFLVVESTDGRTWTPGYSNGALDRSMTATRSLQRRGTNFVRHYSNTPVCCPSRASFWSGRHAHKIPHHNRMPVGGVWNNYEGLPAGCALLCLMRHRCLYRDTASALAGCRYDDRIDQVLGREGYGEASSTGQLASSS